MGNYYSINLQQFFSGGLDVESSELDVDELNAHIELAALIISLFS